MKRISIFVVLLGGLLLNSCKKSGGEQEPPGPLPLTHFSLQLKAPVTLQAGEQVTDYEFIITLSDNEDEPILVDKKLPLIDSGGYYSARMELQRGTYKLLKLLLARKTGLVRFAAPLAGSAKAAQVGNPLSIVVSGGQSALKVQEVEVLAVQLTDRESFFGYPPGIFHLPADPNNPPPLPKILQIHPVIRVGDVVYDSVPAAIQFFSWDEENNPMMLQFASPGGVHKLEVPAGALRVKIRIMKWNGQAELELMTAQLDESKVHRLEITKTPQTIKQLLTYQWLNNTWTATERIDYQYNGNGRLLKKLHYRKRADGTGFIGMTEEAEYVGDRVSKINRTAEDGRPLGHTLFQYDANALVGIIRHQQGRDSVTFTSLSYRTSVDRNNRLQIDEAGASIEYTFSGLKHTYRAEYSKGNLLRDFFASMNGNLEEGLYEVDQAINPFYHNSWPSLSGFIAGPHNINKQYKTYVNAWPAFEISNMHYTYTADGYPKEIRMDHIHPLTRELIGSYKEVYVY